ncbi:MAG: hypothetical protein IPH18_17250 [Chitinophagaceae bacterium]|nr:hypothetical protein [Chitinophagaceae bacterium]
MREIFPSLIDSMYVEITFSMTPPRITEVVDSITGKKKLQTLEKGKTDRELIRNDLSSCEQDSNYIIIVLKDSIHAVYKDNLDIFQSKYSLPKDSTGNSYFQKSYFLTLADLTYRNCFKLKLSSDYAPTFNNPAMFVRQISEVSFSRIIFDADKTHGMLTCEYICGGLCGNGYRVLLKSCMTNG